MPEDLPLEPDLIKVLASDTRREVLRLLRERRMTVTEIARELDLRKATIHEHLGKLSDAGLVERDDEDERLWVYYELTGEGKRLLNPQRTRFYLVVTVGILSLLVVGLAAALFLQMGGTPQPGPSESVDGLQVQLAGDETAADAPRLQATINGVDSDDQLEAYLLTPEEVERLRQHQPSEGIRLHAITGTPSTDDTVSAADGDTTEADRETTATPEATFQVNGEIPPGTYRLYVRTLEGEDNLGAMPEIRASMLTLTPASSQAYRGLSGPVNFTLERDGMPADGQLRITRPDGSTIQAPLPLRTGSTQLEAASIDQIPAGDYQIAWTPNDQTPPMPVGKLAIRDPAIAVTPPQAPAGSPLTLQVQATGTHAEPLPIATPTVQNVSSLDRAQNGTDWLLNLEDPTPGTLRVETGRLAHHDIAIRSHIHAHLEEEGGQWLLSLEDESGIPIADAAIRLDGSELGATNDQGELDLEAPDPGTHRLSIAHPTREEAHRLIVSDEPGWRVLHPSYTISAKQGAARSSSEIPLTITIDAENGSGIPASVTTRIGSRVLDARTVNPSPDAASRIHTTLPGPFSEASRIQVEVAPSPALNVTFGASIAGNTTDATSPASTLVQGDPSQAVADGGDAIDEQAPGTREGLKEPIGARDSGDAAATPSMAPWVAVSLVVGLAFLLRRRRRG